MMSLGLNPGNTHTVDPCMRGCLTESKSYVPPFELGKALEGGCVGKIVESKNNKFAVGDYVLGIPGLY